MKKRLLPILLVFALALCLLPGCAGEGDVGGAAASSSERSEASPAEAAAQDAIPIEFSGDGVTVNGSAAETDGGELTLSEGGLYRITGSAEGRIVVDAADTAEVTLLLDGCELYWPDDEVIYVKTAKSALIYLADGTENTLTSGDVPSGDSVLDEEAAGACLRAKCPMTVTGSGSLTICGYINNGVASSGDITVEAGNINVTAVNDGIKSKSGITVRSGILTIESDMDAIQADGELNVLGGTITIHTGAGSDGADMKVSDSLMMGAGPGGNRGERRGRSSDEASGEADDPAAGEETEPVEAADEADSSAAAEETEPVGIEDEADGSAAVEEAEPVGIEDEADASAADAEAGPVVTDDEEASPEPEGDPEPGASDEPWDMDDGDSPSRKGLKAAGINVSGGSVVIDAEDDGIHSNGSMTQTGGEITVRSGDDGVHADEKVTVSDGTLQVLYAYEGLEAKNVLIEGGLVDVTGVDDGMNVNGGSGFGFGSGEPSDEAEEAEDAAAEEPEAEDSEPEEPEAEDAAPEEPEAEPEEAEDETCVLRITGGTVYVNSGGDGLDSNGSVYIEGGNIFVSGPTSNWDTAIDKGDGSGCEFVITGGVVMAGGSSGMAEAPEETDGSQPSILYSFSDFVEDGALCTLTDSDGNVLLSYEFGNSYNCVILSSPDLVVGETYTLAIGDQQAEIELTSVSFSNRGGGFGGGSRRSSGEASGEAESPTDAAEESAG